MRSHVSHRTVLASLAQTNTWRRLPEDAPRPVSSLTFREQITTLHWLLDNADTLAKAQRLIPVDGLPQAAVGNEQDWLLATPFVGELVERIYGGQFQATWRERGRLSPSESEDSHVA